MVSRRAFLLSGGAALFAAGCGDAEEAPAPATSDTTEADRADVELLKGLFELELSAVIAYEAGRRHVRAAAPFAAHVQEHLKQLSGAMARLGGKLADGRRSLLGGIDVDSREKLVGRLVDLENGLVATYLDALPKLTDPEARGLVAAILTVHAEHIAVLSGPSGPFVVGKVAP